MEGNDTIAITETPYWKKRHKDIQKMSLSVKNRKYIEL